MQSHISVFQDGKTLLLTAFEKKWEEATLVLLEKGAEFTGNNEVNLKERWRQCRENHIFDVVSHVLPQRVVDE